MRIRLGIAGLIGLGAVLAAGSAAAHPHIFIDATLRIAFGADGTVTGIEQTWTFDEFHSVWAVQGLDTNGDKAFSPEELQSLADGYAEGLEDVAFYTSIQAGTAPVTLVRDDPLAMTYEGEQIRMSFTLRPAEPTGVGEGWSIQIADPEYYSAITVLEGPGISLQNAPAGCAVEQVPPKDLDSATLTELYALPPEVTELPPHLAAAMRDASGSIRLTCP